MIKQKLISAKLDESQLQRFDDLCHDFGIKRNKMLNFLVSYANSQLSVWKQIEIMRAYAMVDFDED